MLAATLHSPSACLDLMKSYFFYYLTLLQPLLSAFLSELNAIWKQPTPRVRIHILKILLQVKKLLHLLVTRNLSQTCFKIDAFDRGLWVVFLENIKVYLTCEWGERIMCWSWEDILEAHSKFNNTCWIGGVKVSVHMRSEVISGGCANIVSHCNIMHCCFGLQWLLLGWNNKLASSNESW